MLDLPAVLRHEVDALRLFVAALKGEQDALKTGDTDALPGFVEQKNRTIVLLNRLGQQRNVFLRAAGLGSDRAGLLAWAKTSPDTQRLSEDLLKVAEEAKEINRLNGQLISMRLRATQAALEALTPKAANHGLYSASGQTTIRATGYRLIDSV
jgi:flagellar biosynthesis protein FlgN